MKATAIAHPIQGIVKYHGLKDKKLRLPYHDSISACMQELSTITTVDITNFDKDIYLINGARPEEKEAQRMAAIVDRVRELSGRKERILAVSQNKIADRIFTYDIGKGLGYSSSGGAALAAATAKAFGLEAYVTDLSKLSTIARRLAGSAARSTVGGFARWYADEVDEKSYAVKLAGKEQLPEFRMIVYPIKESGGLKTESAHAEVETSPLFEGRKAYISKVLSDLEAAIKNRDYEKIGSIAEKDSLILHAVTMTGDSHMVAWEPESIAICKWIKKAREKGVKAYVSWDTGPSTFINTTEKYVGEIVAGLQGVVPIKPVVCTIGDEVKLIEEHLF